MSERKYVTIQTFGAKGYTKKRVLMTAKDKRILEAHTDWRDWGALFGWRLFGSSYSHSASFVLPSGDVFQVTAEVRASIDKAFAEATR